MDPMLPCQWQSCWHACPRKNELNSEANNASNNTISKIAVPGQILSSSLKSGVVARIMILRDHMSSSSEIVQGSAKLPAHTMRAGMIYFVHVLPAVSSIGRLWFW